MRKTPLLLVLVMLTARLIAADSAPAPAGAKPAPPLRRTRSGHVSNYDENRVGTYRLPDPLLLADGTSVRDAETWMTRRRPEILRQYEENIYGRVPASAPRAHVQVIAAGDRVEGGAATRKHVVIRFGEQPVGPMADVVLYAPVGTTRPAVLLHMVFSQGLPDGTPDPVLPAAQPGKTPRSSRETGPIAAILAHGYAYATFRYTDVQPDNKTTNAQGVQALAYHAGQTRPEPDEWGTITVWAWAASRVLDYLQADTDVDGRRVALIGHSRLGKTALWASARDPRFALAYASCSGELGASLARRDFGETVDDVAENFPWWFAGNFQKYLGRWDALPVDAHELIALSAPRPVFITGGTDDQWADPRGEFLAAVAAGPVYRLLGRPDLGTTELPPLDHPLSAGTLGWLYHTGGHAMTAEDWTAFLTFADRHLTPR